MLNVPANGKTSVSQLMLPVAITVLALFISVCFQFTQILRDRSSMHDVYLQQAKPLEDTSRLQQQVNALALGTKKLAEKGDKGAKGIMERLEANGVKVNDGSPTATAPTPGPVAGTQPAAQARTARGASATEAPTPVTPDTEQPPAAASDEK